MRDARLLGPGGEQEPNQPGVRFFVIGDAEVTGHEVNFVKAAYGKFRSDVIGSVIPQHRAQLNTPAGGVAYMTSLFGQDRILYFPRGSETSDPPPVLTTATFFCIPFDEDYDQSAPLTRVYEAYWATTGTRVSEIAESARTIFPSANPEALTAHPGNTTWFSGDDGTTLSWWGLTPGRYGVEPDTEQGATSDATQGVTVLYPSIAYEQGFGTLGSLPPPAFTNARLKYPPGTFRQAERPSAMLFGDTAPCLWVNGALVVLDYNVASACLATRDILVGDDWERNVPVVRVCHGAGEIADIRYADVVAASLLPDCYLASTAENTFAPDGANPPPWGLHPPYWNASGSRAAYARDSGAGIELAVTAEGFLSFAVVSANSVVTVQPVRTSSNTIVEEPPDHFTFLTNIIGVGSTNDSATETRTTAGLVERNCVWIQPIALDYRGDELVTLSLRQTLTFNGVSASNQLSTLTFTNTNSQGPLGGTVYDHSTKTVTVARTGNETRTLVIVSELLHNGVTVFSRTWENVFTAAIPASANDVLTRTQTSTDTGADPTVTSTTETHEGTYSTPSTQVQEATGTHFRPAVMVGDLRGDAIYIYLDHGAGVSLPDPALTIWASPFWRTVGRNVFSSGGSSTISYTGTFEQTTALGNEPAWNSSESNSGSVSWSPNYEFSESRSTQSEIGLILEVNPGTGAVQIVGRALPVFSEGEVRTDTMGDVNSFPHSLETTVDFSETQSNPGGGNPTITTTTTTLVPNHPDDAAVCGGADPAHGTISVVVSNNFQSNEQGILDTYHAHTTVNFDPGTWTYVPTTGPTPTPYAPPANVVRRVAVAPGLFGGENGILFNFDGSFPSAIDYNTYQPTPSGLGRAPLASIAGALSPDTAIQYCYALVPPLQPSVGVLVYAPLRISRWFVDGAEATVDIGYKPPADPNDPPKLFPAYSNPIFIGPTP